MTKNELLKKIRNDEYLMRYFETALWSSTDESDETGGEPLDVNYVIDDFTVEGLKEMIAMAEEFINKPKVWSAIEDSLDDWALAGHDLWLTQNGYGVGFWDGDWPEPQATLLTKAAEQIGEAYIYVGDNGKLYIFSG